MHPPDIPGAPPRDLRRSPAAATIGQLAADSGLLLAHYEHRVHLPLPEAWLPQGRGDLGEARSGWQAGRLLEPKYRSFRLDRRIGSFHPGHRGKWTAHELCHGLVGFAWAPGKSALWHATAARLSELLPVVLYYFLDEACLRRCPLHRGGGPLYGAFCRACEEAVEAGPLADRKAEVWLTRGRRFLDGELHAVARTRRLGRVQPHHHATLDLSSDGLAYAAGHLPRLRSDRFADYINRFFVRGGGWHDSLDALIGRIEALMGALAGERTAAPLPGDRVTWVAQDLAWRALQVVEEAEGGVVDALETHVLAPLERAARGGTEADLAAAIDGYRGVHGEWVVPSPATLFGVGYDLPGGLGRAEAQVAAGVASALPATWALLGDAAEDLACDFTWEDAPVRAPIGARFAAWLTGHQGDGPAVDQARFEAAVTHAPAAAADEQTLRGDQPATDALTLAEGAQLLFVSHGVSTDPDVVLEEGVGPLDGELALVVQRQPDGEVAVFQLSDAAAAWLSAWDGAPSAMPGVPDDERAELVALGVLTPVAWRV